MSKSALNGTTWYWREGKLLSPIGSDFHGMTSKELCLPVVNEGKVDAVRTELENNLIEVHTKTVHQGFSKYPDGTKILYAYCPNTSIEYVPEHQRNLEKLKHYIIENGGQIHGQTGQNTQINKPALDLKALFQWFGRGK